MPSFHCRSPYVLDLEPVQSLADSTQHHKNQETDPPCKSGTYFAAIALRAGTSSVSRPAPPSPEHILP